MAAPLPHGIERHYLRVLVDGLPDAAVVVDRDLRPLAWNQLYIKAVGMRGRSFGRKVAEPGVRCRDFYSLEICDQNCLAERVFEHGRPIRMDEMSGGASCQEGSHRQNLIVCTIPIQNDQQETVAVLMIYRDVTAEARIQERYKVLLEKEKRRAITLEEQVHERTTELQQSMDQVRATRAQLIQSEKLSSLGRLVAGIAHEINNPVNFIFGNLDFLQGHINALQSVIQVYESAELSEQTAATMNRAKRDADYEYVCSDLGKLLRSVRLGTERTAGIVRDLMAVCHRSGDAMTAVHIPACLERTLNLLGHAARERITISKEMAESVPLIQGNEGRLNQVFMNLLMNAVQAIPDRGEIHIAVEEADGGVTVKIKDNGVGMPEDVQMKIFDPFFTTRPVGEGTGLGLSITYSIVDAHNGRISVESAPGEGSTFSIWFPDISKEDPADDQ